MLGQLPPSSASQTMPSAPKPSSVPQHQSSSLQQPPQQPFFGMNDADKKRRRELLTLWVLAPVLAAVPWAFPRQANAAPSAIAPGIGANHSVGVQKGLFYQPPSIQELDNARAAIYRTMHPSWNMTPWDSALTRPQQASPRKVTFGQVVPPVSQPDELHEGEKLWVNNTVDSLLSGNPEHERLHAKQMLSWIYTAAKINLNYDEYPAGSGTTTMRGAIKNNTQGLFGHTEPGIEAQKLTEAIFLLGIHHDFNGTVFDLRPDGRPQPANADPNNYQSNQAAYDQARGLFNGITKSFKIARSANSDVRSSVAFAVQQLMASPSIVNAPGGINGGHLGTQAPEQMYFSFQPDGSPLSNKTVDLLRYLNIT